MNQHHATGGLAIIAEDEDLGRVLLCESAKAAGLCPEVFDNGLMALEAILSKDPSLIVLDVDMPGMDGYRVCEHVRTIERLRNVPIVMVTGHDDAEAISRAYRAGATDFVAKPVNWALLPHRLAYVMRNAASVRELADRESKVRALLEAIPDSLWVVSATGQTQWSSDELWSSNHGGNERQSFDVDASVPVPLRAGVHDAIRATATDGIARQIDCREHIGGSSQSAELRFSRCEGGDVLVVRQDTTERTRAAARIEKLAYFDSLTGLPNRQRCIEEAMKQLKLAAHSQQGLGLVYLDLNSFKRINDAFGHSVGDSVLITVAALLSKAIEPFRRLTEHVSVARLGGDEFVVVVRDASAREWTSRLADTCLNALSEPILCQNLDLFAKPSVGTSVFPQDGADIETLLKNADTAMYQSKSSSLRAVTAYTPAMSAQLNDWLALESRLRRAVRDNTLSICYQPKFNLRDGSIAGVEALARWLDPEFGEIPPARFIRLAEETGLIVDIGAWMIGAVCRQLREWLDLRLVVPIAVNVSGKELLYGDPAKTIELEAARAKVPASLIEVEITESVLVEGSQVNDGAIAKLKRMGCKIALDDFGTGYSSLAYLTRFPPHRLKIDRSFVSNIDRSSSDAAVVNAIMSLAKSLDLIVTAEGVERPAQKEWLRARGCQEAQGYLLSRPLSSEEFIKLCTVSNVCKDGKMNSTAA